MADQKTRKWWITPENRVISLSTLHYEYFRDPSIAEKYQIVFRDEETTRLDALRVGFIRVNYECNGGQLTVESMRWDRNLRKLVDGFVLDNAEAIDLARIHLVDCMGQAIQIGCVSLMNLRAAGRPITRLTLSSWNNFRPIKL